MGVALLKLEHDAQGMLNPQFLDPVLDHWGGGGPLPNASEQVNHVNKIYFNDKKFWHKKDTKVCSQLLNKVGDDKMQQH